MQTPMLHRASYRLEESLVEDLARQQWRGYPFRLENFPAGRQIAQSNPEFQARAAMEIIRWLERRGATYDSNSWKMRQALFLLFKRKLPLTEGDILAIIEWSTQVRNAYWRGMPQVIKLVSDHLKATDLRPEMFLSIQQTNGVTWRIDARYPRGARPDAKRKADEAKPRVP